MEAKTKTHMHLRRFVSVAAGDSASLPEAPPLPEGVVPGTGAPSTLAPAPPVPPPPSPNRKRIWVAAGAVVVAVVVVLALLFLSGLFNSHGSTSSTPAGTPVPFSEAVPVAITGGEGFSGGPWTIVAAEGIGLKNGVSGPSPASFTSNACTFSTPSGAPASYAVLATPANATAGDVAAWIFFGKNASLNTVLLIEVSNGVAIPMILMSGCASEVSLFASATAISASSVVDSTDVASELDANGGSTFLSNGTVESQLFILIGGSSSTGGQPVWEVSYSTCALTASSGTGSTLAGYYYATSGTPLMAPSETTVTC